MARYRIALMGCGRQAQPILFELGRWEQTQELLAMDSSRDALRLTRRNLTRLWRKEKIRPAPLTLRQSNAERPSRLAPWLRGFDLLISAAPYRFNLNLAKLSLKLGLHYADLGGHQETALRIRQLSARAKKKNIFLLPDLGLAPGTANILAGWGLQRLLPPRRAVLYVGGLPVNRNLPLGYKLVYSVEGLLSMYYGTTWILREGKRAALPSLTEQEKINFPGLGRLEACVTRGMTAAPWILQGKFKDYVYKTLRYPGHFEAMRVLEKLFPDASSKKILSRILEERFTAPDEKDLVVLRVLLEGHAKGRRAQVTFDCLDFGDPRRGFSAMEKMTGMGAAAACEMALEQFKKTGRGGFWIAEEALNPERYLEFLKQKGINISKKIRYV